MSLMKEHKIYFIDEIAQRLTKTIAEEEQLLSLDLKYIRKNVLEQPKDMVKDKHTKTTENKIPFHAPQERSSVKNIIEKMSNILCEPIGNRSHKLNNNVADGYGSVKGQGLKSSYNPKNLDSNSILLNLPRKDIYSKNIDASSKVVNSSLLKSTASKFYSEKEIYAIVLIQAYFRGYQVRKVTSPLLRYRNIKIKNKTPSQSQHAKVPSAKYYNLKSRNLRDLEKKKHTMVKRKEKGPTQNINKVEEKSIITKENSKINTNLSYLQEISDNHSLKINNLQRKKNMEEQNSLAHNYDKGASEFVSSNDDEIDMKKFCSHGLPSHTTCTSNVKLETQTKNCSHKELPNNVLHNTLNDNSVNGIPLHFNSNSSCKDNSYSYRSDNDTVENEKVNPKENGRNINYLSPSHLSSKISAELLFQDTIGSALSHIQNLQNFKAVSHVKNQSNYRNHRDKSLSFVEKPYEKAVNDLGCDVDMPNFQVKFDKLVKDVQESILKLECETRIKVQQAIESLTTQPSTKTKPLASVQSEEKICSLSEKSLTSKGEASFNVTDDKIVPQNEKGINSVYNKHFSNMNPFKSCENISKELVKDSKKNSENVENTENSNKSSDDKLESNIYETKVDSEIKKPSTQFSTIGDNKLPYRNLKVIDNGKINISCVEPQNDDEEHKSELMATENSLVLDQLTDSSIKNIPSCSYQTNIKKQDFHYGTKALSEMQYNSIFKEENCYLSKFNRITDNFELSSSKKGEAIQNILNLLESLQKEEEAKLNHLINFFKIQEKFLIEEARLKLASIQSDGGLNIRKRQRAILLQLREQQYHIQKCIENQNLTAKQRCSFFSQQYNLLSSTINLSTNASLSSRSKSNTTVESDVSLSCSDDIENSHNYLPLSGNMLEPLLLEDSEIPNKNLKLFKDLQNSNGKSAHRNDLSCIEKGNYGNSMEHKESVLHFGKENLSSPGITNNLCDNSENDILIKPKVLKAKASLFDEVSCDNHYSSSSASQKYEADNFSFNAQSLSDCGNQENMIVSDTIAEKSLISDSVASNENSNFRMHFPSPPKRQKVEGSSTVDITKQHSGSNKEREARNLFSYKLHSPLSPRSQQYQYRRQSSESDDSVSLSHNGTFSDASDIEGRLVALREELSFRKKEADKLKKEEQRIRRERLHSQELALKNQIASYEKFIKRKKMELEDEKSKNHETITVKPLIRKPLVNDHKSSQLPISCAFPETVGTDVIIGNNLLHLELLEKESAQCLKDNSKVLQSGVVAENKGICNEDNAYKEINSEECNVMDNSGEVSKHSSLESSEDVLEIMKLNSSCIDNNLRMDKTIEKRENDLVDPNTSISGNIEISGEKSNDDVSYVTKSTNDKSNEHEFNKDVISNAATDTIIESETRNQEFSSQLSKWLLKTILNDSISSILTVVSIKEQCPNKELDIKIAEHIQLVSCKAMITDSKLNLDYRKEDKLIDSSSSISHNDWNSSSHTEERSENKSKLKKSSTTTHSSAQSDNSRDNATYIDDEEEQIFESQKHSTPKVLCVQSITSEFDSDAGVNANFFVSSCEGQWMESEFWKAQGKVNSHEELREEEELLSAEIARLEELQQFKERFPNLVIREVPDKPPPPYTPPKENFESPKVGLITGKLPDPQTPSNTISVPHRLSKADLRTIASSIVNIFPSKEKLTLAVEEFSHSIYTEWQKGTHPEMVEFEAVSLTRKTSNSKDEIEATLGENERTLMRLIFHLTQQLVAEVYHMVHAPPAPVWSHKKLHHSNKSFRNKSHVTEEGLLDYVVRKTLILFGMDSPLKVESSLTKWALKRKEHVDQILVRDLQQEELNWVDYNAEEVEVKVVLSQDILSSLIDETLNIFQVILTKFKNPP